MLNARFGHQAWGFLSSCASACVSVHVKIAKPEKHVLHTQMHKNSEKPIPYGLNRVFNIEAYIFAAFWYVFYEVFRPNNNCRPAPGCPKHHLKWGFWTFRQKCIFTRILPCKTGLAEVCRSEKPIQNGRNRVSRAPEPLKITTSKNPRILRAFWASFKNCIFARKIRGKNFVFEVCV